MFVKNFMKAMFVLTACLFSLAFSTQAVAQSCPGIYAALTCNGGGTDVCTMATSSVWECDLKANGTGVSGDATVVYGYSATDDYSAWGMDASGSRFCCQKTDTNIRTVALLGGPDDDTLSF